MNILGSCKGIGHLEMFFVMSLIVLTLMMWGTVYHLISVSLRERQRRINKLFPPSRVFSTRGFGHMDGIQISGCEIKIKIESVPEDHITLHNEASSDKRCSIYSLCIG